jgi:hypothetical protein
VCRATTTAGLPPKPESDWVLQNNRLLESVIPRPSPNPPPRLPPVAHGQNVAVEAPVMGNVRKSQVRKYLAFPESSSPANPIRASPPSLLLTVFHLENPTGSNKNLHFARISSRLSLPSFRIDQRKAYGRGNCRADSCEMSRLLYLSS